MLNRIHRKLRPIFKSAAQRIRTAGPSKNVIVLVVGVQRSGTNMVMDTFDNSFIYGVFHDHDPRAFENYVPRPLETVRECIDRHPAPNIVLKPMTEMYRLRTMLDQLVRSDQNERGVGLWLYRRMGDVVNSHVRRWRDMPDSLRRIAEDPSWSDWRSGGLSEESRALIRRHATNDLSNESACALFWYVRNLRFFEQGYDGMADVALVPYERFVSRPRESFRKLFSVMKLPFKEAMVSHVHSRSVNKNQMPDVDPEILSLCSALEVRFDDFCDDLAYCPSAEQSRS